jgi:hypothetical protein
VCWVSRVLWLVRCWRLRCAEDRDDPVRAGDLGPGDEHLDQRFALAVAAEATMSAI